MNKLFKFLDSSVGKKILMSITGLFLALFLIEHLIGNLLVLKSDGGQAFNDYSEFMASGNNIVVRAIEIILFLAIILHIINGVRLWMLNKNKRELPYTVNRPSENSSFYSRFMIQSGIVIFIFLIIHLSNFFWKLRFEGVQMTPYQLVKTSFEELYYSIFYIICMVLLAFHLNHGFQSGFRSLGLVHSKYTPFIKKFGTWFAILLSLGFAVIPFYFLVNTLSGGN